MLFESVVEAALWSAITQATSSACFVGDVVLEIGLGGGPTAAWSGAGGMPDLGQVPELDPGIMTLGLEPVITLIDGDRVERDEEIPIARCPESRGPACMPAAEPYRWYGGGAAGRRAGLSGHAVLAGWRQATDFDQLQAKRLALCKHSVEGSLVGEHA